jgi:predicted membrane protein
MIPISLSDIRFNQKSKIILWIEAGVFAVIYGLMFKTWIVTAGLVLIASLLMNKPRMEAYKVYWVSFLWCPVFFAIGFTIGGWIGGLILGGLVMYKGIKLHWRDLKRSQEDENIEAYVNAEKWRQNWHLGPQNLN